MSQGTNITLQADTPRSIEGLPRAITVRDFANEIQQTPPGKGLSNQPVNPADETCDTRASSPALPDHIASQPLPSYQTTPRGSLGSPANDGSSRKYRKPTNCPPTPGPPPDRPTPTPKHKPKLKANGELISNGSTNTNKTPRVSRNGTAISFKASVHRPPSHANESSAVSPDHADKALEAYRHLQQTDAESGAIQDESCQSPLPDYLRRSRLYSPMPKVEIHQPTLGPVLSLRSVNGRNPAGFPQGGRPSEMDNEVRRGLFDPFRRPRKFVQRLRQVSDSITRRAAIERIDRADRPQRPPTPELFQRNILQSKQSLPVLPLYATVPSEEPRKMRSIMFETEIENFQVRKQASTTFHRALSTKAPGKDSSVEPGPKAVDDPIARTTGDPSRYFSSHAGSSTEDLGQFVEQARQRESNEAQDQVAVTVVTGELRRKNTPLDWRGTGSSLLATKISDFSAQRSDKQSAQTQDEYLPGAYYISGLSALDCESLTKGFADLPPISPTKKCSIPKPLRVCSKSSTNTVKEATCVPQIVLDNTEELSKLVAEMSDSSGSDPSTVSNMARSSPEDKSMIMSSTPPKGPLSPHQLALQDAADRGLRRMAERSYHLRTLQTIQATLTPAKESPDATPRATQSPETIRKVHYDEMDDGNTPRAGQQPNPAWFTVATPYTPTPVGRALRPSIGSQQNLRTPRPRKTAWYNPETGMIETPSGLVPPLTNNPAIQATYEQLVGVSGPGAPHVRENKSRDDMNPMSGMVIFDFSEPVQQTVPSLSAPTPVTRQQSSFALTVAADADGDVFGPSTTTTSIVSPQQPQPVRPWGIVAGSSSGLSHWMNDEFDNNDSQSVDDDQENKPVIDNEIEYNPWR